MKASFQIQFLKHIAGIICLFDLQASAQDTSNTGRQYHLPDPQVIQPWVGLPAGHTKEGVPDQLLQEYENIIYKYSIPYETWWRDLQVNITVADKKKLETIFRKMNREQQSKQQVIFIPSFNQRKMRVPTRRQLDAWKNSSLHGVWINGKKVNNAVLSQYSNTGFAHAQISTLYGEARSHVSYAVHVNLFTKSYYPQYRQALANQGIEMVCR